MSNKATLIFFLHPCYISVPAVSHPVVGLDSSSERDPGGGGDSHMKQTGMLVGNFEFNP